MSAEKPIERFNYCMINNDPPEYGIDDKEHILPPVRVSSVNQAQKVCKKLNEQFKKPSSIPDTEMNNLAYYCSMVYEMFLTVNWEYEKLGKGTTHHEVIRAGTETLAKEYYYNFKEILKQLGYDKNIGDDFIKD